MLLDFLSIRSNSFYMLNTLEVILEKLDMVTCPNIASPGHNVLRFEVSANFAIFVRISNISFTHLRIFPFVCHM